MATAELLVVLAESLCGPLQIIKSNHSHSVPSFIYEFAKIIRSYAPMLYFCGDKVIVGTATNHIMRITSSPQSGRLFVTDFRTIYGMKRIARSSSRKLANQSDSESVYGSKRRKSASPFFECTELSTVRVSSSLEVDAEDNVFYILGVGMFKEALFVLRRNPKALGSASKQPPSEYLKVRRVHTFRSGDGVNRILSVNPNLNHSENGKRYSIIHCRAKRSFFRMKYAAKSHDLEIEEWKFKSDFPEIQWMASYPFSDNFCFALTVDDGAERVEAVLHGIWTEAGNPRCGHFELFRFEMASLKALSERAQQHHCRCMCFLQRLHRLCVVVEGQCYLVRPDPALDIQGGVGDRIRNKAFWSLYKIGTMMQRDARGRARVFYPNSIAPFRDSQFVIGVDATDKAAIFEIVC